MKYLAYGSNMLTQRLQARVPSASNPLQLALTGYALRFHKRSKDKSGKCNLIQADSGSVVHCVVFNVADAQMGALDNAEAVGAGYHRDSLLLNLGAGPERVAVYFADEDFIDESLRPYRWYRDLILAGAEQHQLPQPYRQSLEAEVFHEDPDPNRPERLEALRILDLYSRSKYA